MRKTDISRPVPIAHSGFTIIGLVIALAILAVLITIATYIYAGYISMAKTTIARSILDEAGKTLFDYQIDHGAYPASIDFTGCTDEDGRTVFTSGLCDQMKNELYSIESYSIESYAITSTRYVLAVRAKDKGHTLLKLTEGKITK